MYGIPPIPPEHRLGFDPGTPEELRGYRDRFRDLLERFRNQTFEILDDARLGPEALAEAQQSLSDLEGQFDARIDERIRHAELKVWAHEVSKKRRDYWAKVEAEGGYTPADRAREEAEQGTI